MEPLCSLLQRRFHVNLGSIQQRRKKTGQLPPPDAPSPAPCTLPLFGPPVRAPQKELRSWGTAWGTAPRVCVCAEILGAGHAAESAPALQRGPGSSRQPALDVPKYFCPLGIKSPRPQPRTER